MAEYTDRQVSVVIPCHSQRRWPQLIAAVESVLQQRPRPVEVVVVVDRNDELFERAKNRWPEVTVLANALQAGASGNRNTGIRHTRTPLVALLDDDACARPGWLDAMTAPLSDPTVIGTGSTIMPVWESSRPMWFPDELLWAVVSTSSTETECTAVRNVWSASMALRRDVFEIAGGFRLGFGKQGNRSRPEDTDLCLRMSRVSAGRWMYVPAAVVDHMIPRDRMTVRSILTRCYHEGRGKIELARLTDDRSAFGIEREFMRKTVPYGLVSEFSQLVRGRGVVHSARAGMLLLGAGMAIVGAAVEMLRPQHAYVDGLVGNQPVPEAEFKVAPAQRATAPAGGSPDKVAAGYPAKLAVAGPANSIEPSAAQHG
jgi:glucosyl-dolichyl phosphate glucuronosyltransferase